MNLWKKIQVKSRENFWENPWYAPYEKFTKLHFRVGIVVRYAMHLMDDVLEIASGQITHPEIGIFAAQGFSFTMFMRKFLVIVSFCRSLLYEVF